MSITLMKQWLEALELCEDAMSPTKNVEYDYEVFKELTNFANQAITSLRQAIALEESLVAKAEKKITYTGNGTAGRETDAKSNGFFFQIPEKQERLCHVFNVNKSGALTEWEPTTMAFSLPDGTHALYTTPQRLPLTDEQKDAKRYRWLRNKAMGYEGVPFICILNNGYTGQLDGEAADKEIDEAIEAAHGIKENT